MTAPDEARCVRVLLADAHARIVLLGTNDRGAHEPNRVQQPPRDVSAESAIHLSSVHNLMIIIN